MKKIIALAIALLMCFPLLCSCGNRESVPDNMQRAYIDGEPFKLYVPEGMSVNLDSGISSAFKYAPDKVIISARYYTPNNPEMTLSDYMTYCADGYSKSISEFNMTSLEPSILSSIDAIKMTYTAKIDDIAYSCTQITALYKGDMISLCFYIPSSVVDGYAETVKSVTEEFIICDKAEPINDEVVDKKTPEGMKIASEDQLEYRFYVPKSWICNSESGKSEAYYPESAKSNVTVTSYSPEEEMTTAEYIAMCKETYASTIAGYELLEESNTKVNEKDAISMVFKANYDGIDIRIKQVSLIYGGMAYSITYTAIAENYDLHIEDVDKIISEFTFR
jgi:hypothetical protein